MHQMEINTHPNPEGAGLFLLVWESQFISEKILNGYCYSLSEFHTESLLEVVSPNLDGGSRKRDPGR